MNKKKVIAIVGLALIVPMLGGCWDNSHDRESGAGMAADTFQDTSDVTVWRNADEVPNLATFCADGRAWVATLNSNNGRGQLLRDTEMDNRCQK